MTNPYEPPKNDDTPKKQEPNIEREIPPIAPAAILFGVIPVGVTFAAEITEASSSREITFLYSLTFAVVIAMVWKAFRRSQ